MATNPKEAWKKLGKDALYSRLCEFSDKLTDTTERLINECKLRRQQSEQADAKAQSDGNEIVGLRVQREQDRKERAQMYDAIVKLTQNFGQAQERPMNDEEMAEWLVKHLGIFGRYSDEDGDDRTTDDIGIDIAKAAKAARLLRVALDLPDRPGAGGKLHVGQRVRVTIPGDFYGKTYVIRDIGPVYVEISVPGRTETNSFFPSSLEPV